jgi:phosphatidylserine decarboxylase
MKFHKEGYASILVVMTFITILIAFAHIFMYDYTWFRYTIYIVSVFLLVIVAQFFRSPIRTISYDDNAIISPADGKVVVIEETEENEYFKEKRIQVSIFMSPVNVHLNRYPFSGVIKYVKYHPGLYLVAWHPKSSTENERSTIVLEHPSGVPVLLRQIAGALARRIVYYCREGQQVKQGEELGFIKFGSRVDLFLPLNTKICVNLNDKVKGGQSVIAVF